MLQSGGEDRSAAGDDRGRHQRALLAPLQPDDQHPPHHPRHRLRGIRRRRQEVGQSTAHIETKARRDVCTALYFSARNVIVSDEENVLNFFLLLLR